MNRRVHLITTATLLVLYTGLMVFGPSRHSCLDSGACRVHCQHGTAQPDESGGHGLADHACGHGQHHHHAAAELASVSDGEAPVYPLVRSTTQVALLTGGCLGCQLQGLGHLQDSVLVISEWLPVVARLPLQASCPPGLSLARVFSARAPPRG